MANARMHPRQGLVLVTVMTLVGLALPARAAEHAWSAKALALNAITGTDPIEGQIKSLVNHPASAHKLLAAAVRLAEGDDQPFQYNAAFILARTAQELKDVDTAQRFYTLCTEQAIQLQSGQKMVQSFGYLIDLLYDNKQYDEVIAACRQFVELPDNDTVSQLKPAVLERMIQALAREGKIAEAFQLVNKLVKIEEEEGGWWFLQVKAAVQREAGQLADAAHSYETVLKRIRKDKTLKKDPRAVLADEVRYLLSNIYADLNQIDKAVAHLQRLLQEHPDNPTFNNDLGYLWAEHDRNLDEAEKLIRKALDEDRKQRRADPEYDSKDDRDAAAYLDSLGWVLYKQGKYAEAEKCLREAIQDPDGRDIEIYDHLGDVLLAQKKKHAAIHAWNNGIKAAGDSERERERKTQVEEKVQALKKD